MKIFALLTAFMIVGVVFMGCATTGYSEIPGYKKVDVNTNGNISFLAPAPINYTIIPVSSPHEIYIGSQRFFEVTEM
ncbi:MAG TPA: hypothetical protein ENI33_01475 [Thermoplasmatales archaeon]|nr:hypothetical protein [Thermoplasmatales archaeon]